MIYLDDRFTQHPKILKAAAMIGEHGVAFAVTMYLHALSYAKTYETDGFVPNGFVSGTVLISSPEVVAKAFVSRRVGLWHKVRGGYLIHDFLKHNRSSKELNDIREKRRIQKRRERTRDSDSTVNVSPILSPSDVLDDSRARASTYHVPLGDIAGIQRTSRTRTSVTDASASECGKPVENFKPGDVATDLRDCEDRPRPRPTDDVRGLVGRIESRNHPAGKNVSDEPEPTTVGVDRERNRSR